MRKINTLDELRSFLGETMRLVRDGKLGEKEAEAIAYLADVFASTWGS